jgi:hypothetical protein
MMGGGCTHKSGECIQFEESAASCRIVDGRKNSATHRGCQGMRVPASHTKENTGEKKDTVFVFHNGAESYYGVRGWRGVVSV